MNEEFKNKSFLSSIVIGGITGGIEAFISNPLVTIKTCLQKGTPIILKQYFPKNTPQLSKGIIEFTKFLYRGAALHVTGMASIIAIRMLIRDMLVKHGFKTNRPTINQEIASAYVGGAVSALLTAPMELGMTLQQTADPNHKSPNFLDIYKKISSWGLSKGLTGITCVGLRDGLGTASFLTFTPQLKKYLNEKCKINDITASIVSGSSVGTAYAIVTHPLDTIKTIQQTNLRDSNHNKASSITYATKQILTEDGIRGFYRGLFFRTMRVVPHIAIVSFVSEKLTTVWQNRP